MNKKDVCNRILESENKSRDLKNSRIMTKNIQLRYYARILNLAIQSQIFLRDYTVSLNPSFTNSYRLMYRVLKKRLKLK